MDKCLFENKDYYAKEIKTFESEKQFRQFGRENKLFCFGCGKPVIYKRGEIVGAHFAHKIFERCEYETYLGTKSPVWEHLKELLAQHFTQLGYQVEKDARLIPHHYSDLYLKHEDGNFVIEIDDKTLSARKLDDLIKSYEALELPVDWIVLDWKKANLYEDQTYYIKRARLNEQRNHSLILFDRGEETFTIYYLDTRKYLYSFTQLSCHLGSPVFQHSFKLSELQIEQNQLNVKGFSELLSEWLAIRLLEFNKRDTVRFRPPWGEEEYLEAISQIVQGKLAVQGHVLRQLQIYPNEYDLFIGLYHRFKDFQLVPYIQAFESIIKGEELDE